MRGDAQSAGPAHREEVVGVRTHSLDAESLRDFDGGAEERRIQMLILMAVPMRGANAVAGQPLGLGGQLTDHLLVRDPTGQDSSPEGRTQEFPAIVDQRRDFPRIGDARSHRQIEVDADRHVRELRHQATEIVQ